jgi:hypothetical protein
MASVRCSPGETSPWSQRTTGDLAGWGSPELLGLLFGGRRRRMGTPTAQFTSREEDDGGPLDPR